MLRVPEDQLWAKDANHANSRGALQRHHTSNTRISAGRVQQVPL